MKRIVTLTTSRTGGGGIAALNLAERLQQVDFEVVVISRENVDNIVGTHKFICRLKSQISRLVTFFNHSILTRRFGLISPYSYGYLSYRSIMKLNPDEVHIHNWYNLISLKTLRKLIENQITVLTAHDARILSGACHVLLECRKFRGGCNNCPAIRVGKHSAARSWRSLRGAMNAPNKLTIVSPSKWLEEELKQTLPSESNLRILNIENMISDEYFSQNLYLPKKEIKKILFVSADLNAEFKGGKILIEAMELVAERDNSRNWKVNLVGKGDLRFANQANLEFQILSLSSQLDLISMYKSADLLVIPSSFDNFPTVAIEAQLCGLPVLGTRVGGIPEILQNGKNGFLCDFNKTAIAELILSLTTEELNRIGKQAFEDAKIRFSNHRVFAEYERIFR